MVAVKATAAPAQEELVDEMGFKLMRKGVKVAANDTILTPRSVYHGDDNTALSSSDLLPYL